MGFLYMRKEFKSPLSLLAGIVMLSSPAVSQAVDFYYDGYGGFVSGTDTPPGVGTYANDADTATGGAFDVGADADSRNPGNVYVDVSWGTATGSLGPYDGQSGLALSRVDDGTVADDGTAVTLGVLTHFNRPIGSGTSLDSSQMQWTLALFDNSTDAANAETSDNANSVYLQTATFTLYNWETANSGYAPGGFRYFDGADWVSNGATSCPNFFVSGTPVTSSTSGTPAPEEIFISDGNPTAATLCEDAHIYLPKTYGGTTFLYNGETYALVMTGFYAPEPQGGELTDTFWACENVECWGTVKFAITGPQNSESVPVPTLPEWAMIMMVLLLSGTGWIALRRGGANRFA